MSFFTKGLAGIFNNGKARKKGEPGSTTCSASAIAVHISNVAAAPHCCCFRLIRAAEASCC